MEIVNSPITTPTPIPSNGPSAGSGLKAVVGSQFCLPFALQLTVVKSAVNATGRGDLTVTGVHGVVIFNVKKEAITLRDRCVLLDGVGNPVVTVRKKMRSIHHRWVVFRGGSKGENKLLFSVKQASILHLRSEYDVFLADNTSEDSCDFKIKGNYLNRQCTVYVGSSDTIIAQMSRQYTITNALLGKDTFSVAVHPNVDYAFIVALIVILDGIHKNEDNHSTPIKL